MRRPFEAVRGQFYATDKLPAAEMVVVYKHQDDWCAIRPPEGSFSWVKADDLRISSEGIGIVLAEGAASRVGSRISDLRDVIQVRLERGEEVEVLDAVQVSNDNGVKDVIARSHHRAANSAGFARRI